MELTIGGSLPGNIWMNIEAAIRRAWKRYTALMISPVMWHGSPTGDPQSILTKGLIGTADYHESPSVYLAHQRPFAEEYADFNGPDQPGHLFQIDTSHLDPHLFEEDEWDPSNAGKSIAYRGNIPPEAITHVPR